MNNTFKMVKSIKTYVNIILESYLGGTGGVNGNDLIFGACLINLNLDGEGGNDLSDANGELSSKIFGDSVTMKSCLSN